jgi:hypothetical protein
MTHSDFSADSCMGRRRAEHEFAEKSVVYHSGWVVPGRVRQTGPLPDFHTGAPESRHPARPLGGGSRRKGAARGDPLLCPRPDNARRVRALPAPERPRSQPQRAVLPAFVSLLRKRRSMWSAAQRSVGSARRATGRPSRWVARRPDLVVGVVLSVRAVAHLTTH